MPEAATARPQPRALAAGLHWTEWAFEAWALGLFMVSACGFGVLLFHPASAVVRALPDPLARRALMGVAMGLTIIINIYSPWGRRSGAHLNPAVTLTFFRLGKVSGTDAIGYVVAQFIGGVLGTYAAVALFSAWIADPSVDYVVTVPGPWGVGPAFLGELVTSFLLILMVLTLSSSQRAAPYTGLVAGVLVATYITVEAPISGMSMNPARTVGSALPAMRWTGLWIYFTAPLMGMLLAAEVRRRFLARLGLHCAKMHHDPRYRCIFCEHVTVRGKK